MPSFLFAEKPKNRMEQRVIPAVDAMKTIGIAPQVTRSALKRLLKAYDGNWEYIEEENYRLLADAIFESQVKLLFWNIINFYFVKFIAFGLPTLFLSFSSEKGEDSKKKDEEAAGCDKDEGRVSKTYRPPPPSAIISPGKMSVMAAILST